MKVKTTREIVTDEVTDWCCKQLELFCIDLGRLRDDVVEVTMNTRETLCVSNYGLRWFKFCPYCGKEIKLEK